MKYAKIPEDCLMPMSDSDMHSGKEDRPTSSESESSSDSEEEREKRLKELQEQVCEKVLSHTVFTDALNSVHCYKQTDSKMMSCYLMRVI